ncbi:MAG TPA: hypothetical protein H9976_09165, partial [Candidatus Akkermansia intestinavium]|nr:hypothetical protein [Candidatus Akkermansia intestinavium]
MSGPQKTGARLPQPGGGASALCAFSSHSRTPRRTHEKSLALLLIVWNDVATEQREEEKNNAEGRKNIEHGGEISYHAQCVQS